MNNRLDQLQKVLLMGPGPSCVSESVYTALAKPTLGHLDPSFIEIMDNISNDLIKAQYEKYAHYKPSSIIIRTLPNLKEKQFYSFAKNTPPFFTNDALKFLSNKIQHLVVDIPSIDRTKLTIIICFLLNFTTYCLK